jgi:hypothetical protein
LWTDSDGHYAYHADASENVINDGGQFMNGLKYLVLAAAVGICFTVSAPRTDAQVSLTVGIGGANIGPAPDCPYGYYDYAPYSCAPYGYFGPEWFTGGAFIGAGPWFHGSDNFQGHVNNRFDAQRGYRGSRPNPGDKPEPSKRLDKVSHFKGNEMRDGRGHVSAGKR